MGEEIKSMEVYAYLPFQKNTCDKKTPFSSSGFARFL